MADPLTELELALNARNCAATYEEQDAANDFVTDFDIAALCAVARAAQRADLVHPIGCDAYTGRGACTCGVTAIRDALAPLVREEPNE